MDPLDHIAEDRIREAIERGDFDDLPLSGRPLALEDLSGVPADLRACYMLLRSAGVLPEEMQLRKEALTLRGLLAACDDAERAADLRRELRSKLSRYRLLMERRGGPLAPLDLDPLV